MGENEFICRFLSTPPASTMKRNGGHNIILNILFQQIFFSLSLTTPPKKPVSIEDSRKKGGEVVEEGGSHETNGFKNWISSEPQCCVGCLLTIYAPGGSQEKPCSLGKSHGSRLRLWQIQHRYASVHGTGKIPGR